MCIIPRSAAAVVNVLSLLGGCPMQLSQRIEPFEYQTTVVAKEFVKTDKTEQYDGIVVIPLNALTFTSRAPHVVFNLAGYCPIGLRVRKFKARESLTLSRAFVNNPGDFLTVPRSYPRSTLGSSLAPSDAADG
jgi:hypothetical protein